jgi:GNAT superfamily N-acetyltransferase
MIREGTPADLPQITHVRTHVIENHMSVEEMAARGITNQSIALDMLSGVLGCWVAEAESRIVAFSMADKRDGNIFALFTLPQYECHGFGSQLLRNCEVWLKEQGCVEAKLDTDETSKANQFYLKRGWQRSPEIHKIPGEIYLRKMLG